jgi:D-cysteine desulfhydrase
LRSGNIWIKNDSEAGDLGGGTKARKLELLLGEARAAGKSHLLSIGAVGSHHLLTTARFAHRFGFAFKAFVCKQPMSDAARRNLLMIHGAGAQLSYGGGEVATFMRFLAASLRRRRNEYPIPPGASCPLGIIGVVNAAFELRAQIQSGMMPVPAVIVCALGSGGTLAGLTLGVRLAGIGCRVIGIRVYPSKVCFLPACTVGHVSRLIARTYALLRKLDSNLVERRIPAPEILDDYLGHGYAIPSVAGEQARERLMDDEGVELDSTYTAKTFAAVLDLVRQNYAGDLVLYWHSFGNARTRVDASLPAYGRLPIEFQSMFENESS